MGREEGECDCIAIGYSEVIYQLIMVIHDDRKLKTTH